MAISTTVTPNDVSIVDALWTLITPLKQSAKELLASRLKESLVIETKQKSQVEEIGMSEAMDFVNTLSARGKQVVPEEENGIVALIDEKYKL